MREAGREDEGLFLGGVWAARGATPACRQPLVQGASGLSFLDLLPLPTALMPVAGRTVGSLDGPPISAVAPVLTSGEASAQIVLLNQS